MEGVMELAKTNLDMRKEVAPEEVARDGNGTDRGIEGETSKLRMEEIESMNSRGNGEPGGRAQPHFSACHQIDLEVDTISDPSKTENSAPLSR
jgi:hypothetical protein